MTTSAKIVDRNIDSNVDQLLASLQDGCSGVAVWVLAGGDRTKVPGGMLARRRGVILFRDDLDVPGGVLLLPGVVLDPGGDFLPRGECLETEEERLLL